MLMKIIIMNDEEEVLHEVMSSILNGYFQCDYPQPLVSGGMTLFGYEFAAKFSQDPIELPTEVEPRE